MYETLQKIADSSAEAYDECCGSGVQNHPEEPPECCAQPIRDNAAKALAREALALLPPSQKDAAPAGKLADHIKYQGVWNTGHATHDADTTISPSADKERMTMAEHGQGEKAKEIRQHLGWLTQYAEMMDETNWRDMKLRIEKQLRELAG